ncbi:MAG: hypothetical protein J3R72DRAFT_523043 [Linnemannia gamsii]|nr:MAG: hypothetical protein J3R72DRAFT_523043 [Linnemannia gamsii]
MSTGGANPSSSKPSGFMSGYMSDLSQTQDLNSFLQKNQPSYVTNSNSTTTSTAAAPAPVASNTDTDTKPKDMHTSSTPTSSTSSSTPLSPSSSSSSSSPPTESVPTPTAAAAAEGGGRKPFGANTPIGAHPLPTAHSVFQKKAIHSAALDNCADLNMEMTDCLMGRAGTWWDRATMCMKAKERFALCCRLNKEALQEKGYAKEGNTAAQDVAILDYADEVTQKAMKEGPNNTDTNTNTTTQEK